MTHTLVVGAGIVGAALAHALAARGHRVTVLDRHAPGGDASAASFGWLNASFAETDSYARLRADALAEWHRLLPLPGAAMTGALWFEETGDAFDAQVEALVRRGHPHEVVGRNRIAALEPALADPPERAIHTPTEGGAAPEVAARALLERSDATVRTGVTVERLIDGGVATDHGDLRADHVVLAVGAATARLTGGAVRMRTVPGLLIHTRPVDPVVRGVVMGPDVHFRQRADGRIVMGEIFSGGVPEGTDPGAFAEDMLSRLSRRLPGVRLEIETVLHGVRPVPHDGLPVLGALPGRFGVTVAAMHSGATLAPLVARLLADEIAGTPRAALAPFRPDRFA